MKRCVLAVALALAAGCGQQPPESRVEAAEAAGADRPAASLPVADLAVLRGLIADADAADRVLVIDFWATWCKPCVALFPALHAGLERMGDAVEPITVTLDSPGKYERRALAFLNRHDALDGAYLLSAHEGDRIEVVDALGDQWNMLVVPAILIFDRDGNPAGEFYGGDAAPILERVRELVRKESPQMNTDERSGEWEIKNSRN